jgi:hypothetical protein
MVVDNWNKPTKLRLQRRIFTDIPVFTVLGGPKPAFIDVQILRIFLVNACSYDPYGVRISFRRFRWNES